jgi:ketosteroid isomerase-like protein
MHGPLPVLWLAALVAAFAVVPPAASRRPQADDAAPIQRMVATERAFAAAAHEVGVRDSFLTFFADDAVAIVRGAPGQPTSLVPAKAQLAARPLQALPLQADLLWEPFTGQVSGDGSMGWLTGGYAVLSSTTRDLLGQGAYFSVWKRQANGTWRVWLDEGIALPDVWRDASPFRAAPDPDAGATGAASDTVALAEARVAAGGDAWISSLGADVRLHREGVMPLVGREAAVVWARAAWRTMRYDVLQSALTASDDLAVVIGDYHATSSAGAESGSWVRVWKRDITGHWRIVFETSHPS